MNLQTDNRFPVLPSPKTSSRGINKKGFPKLPILSNSEQELGPIDVESFLTSNLKVGSSDNLPLTSTLTPLPSSWELRELEAGAIQMDKCCSFRLDCIVFKDSVPCLGNHLQDDMAKIVNSLHPKTALSFRSKIQDLSRLIDHSISTYNSACKMAAVRIDMLDTRESLLTEKVSRQRSQIEILESKVEKLTDLLNATNACTSDEFEKQRIELNQKDKIIRSLEEEVKILKVDKFIEQSPKLGDKDKTGISVEEVKDLKASRFKERCSELDEKNETIQLLKETASLEIVKLDMEKFRESQQNLEFEVFSTSCENSISERKSEAEIEINEFDEILELGKSLSKNLLSIQKAKELRLIQNETNRLKMATGDQKIRQEALEELNLLKSQNASLMEQLHLKEQIFVNK